jgi:hypothetical protein
MIGADLARAINPAAIMTDAGLVPDDWQVGVLQSSASQLLCCSRQSGKSTAAAAKALHVASYTPASLSLLISPSQRQSGELFRKVIDLHRALPDGIPADNVSALRMELRNGSRIIALPGAEATVRGYSGASLIVADEAARIPDSLYHAIRPMLATTRGQFIAMTTPYGCRGWFFEAWTGGDSWKRTRITANDCPRIADDWLTEERRLIGEWAFRQEYLCEFVDTEDAFFSAEIIAAAFDPSIAPLWEAA